MTKLGAWLSRITPRVLQELEKGCKSHVFDEYKLQEDSTDLNIKHLFTLSKEENDSESNVSIINNLLLHAKHVAQELPIMPEYRNE